nr:hypothetical protein [uncultured Mediterranean phage uvMED]|tara:strand:- start:576 stop:737 length:162 start_codon:yes stop_codon:yes gene_type:complete
MNNTFTQVLDQVPTFYNEMEGDLEMIIDFVESQLGRDVTPTEIDQIDTVMELV